jgi:hypothetical protein
MVKTCKYHTAMKGKKIKTDTEKIKNEDYKGIKLSFSSLYL